MDVPSLLSRRLYTFGSPTNLGGGFRFRLENRLSNARLVRVEALELTIPSLIVATYGGGTGLATQRECLEAMDCYGAGKVCKLAEIVAGVALAGELSLGAAISSHHWVSRHERYGRNR